MPSRSGAEHSPGGAGHQAGLDAGPGGRQDGSTNWRRNHRAKAHYAAGELFGVSPMSLIDIKGRNDLTGPLSGQRYWRSLDDLADKPEFRKWVEQEFPAGASELLDGASRRHMLKI